MIRAVHLSMVPRRRRTFFDVSLSAALLITAACGGSSVTPTPAPTPTIIGISIAGLNGTATVGEHIALTAAASMSDGTRQDITTQATWGSTNAAVATVTATGELTVLAAGETDIGAKYKDLS